MNAYELRLLAIGASEHGSDALLATRRDAKEKDVFCCFCSNFHFRQQTVFCPEIWRTPFFFSSVSETVYRPVPAAGSPDSLLAGLPLGGRASQFHCVSDSRAQLSIKSQCTGICSRDESSLSRLPVSSGLQSGRGRKAPGAQSRPARDQMDRPLVKSRQRAPLLPTSLRLLVLEKKSEFWPTKMHWNL